MANLRAWCQLAVLACLLVPGMARAVVVFDSGPPNHLTAAFADDHYGYRRTAVPFMLEPGASGIAGARWWGGCFNVFGTGFEEPCNDADLVVAIFTNQAGRPGTMLEQFEAGGANQTATTLHIAGLAALEYEYDVSFPAVDLEPGTVYWFVVGNRALQGRDSVDNLPLYWAMEATRSAGLGHAFSLDDRGWTDTRIQLALELRDERVVAEPPMLGLMALALAALGPVVAGGRHRRRASGARGPAR